MERTLERSSSSVALETAKTTAVTVLRLACQSAVMVASVRLLGTDGYGLVSAIVAVSLVLGPLAGVGFDFVALREVASGKAAPAGAFWSGLLLTLLTSVPLGIVACVAGQWWFSESFDLLTTLLILASEFLFLRSTELIAKILQGIGSFMGMANVRLSNSLSRLAVLLPALFMTAALDPRQWAWLYLVSSILSFAFSVRVLAARTTFTIPRMNGRFNTKSDLVDGLHFAGGAISTRLTSELDKALVLGLASALSAGLYALCYRIVTLAALPIVNLINVTIGSLYSLTRTTGANASARRALAIIAAAAAHGLVVGVIMWLFLPDLVSLILGKPTSLPVGALSSLSLLAFFMSCRVVAEQGLAAVDRLNARSRIQWSVAAVALVCNLYLIPRFDWVAAAWSCAFAEALLASLYVLQIRSVCTLK